MTEEQISRLETLGMVWDNKFERQWNLAIEAYVKYIKQHKTSSVTYAYVDETGFKLGVWYQRQRFKFKKGELSEDRINQLENVGMIFNDTDPWEYKYQLAKAYFVEHGDLNVPGNYVTDGVWLNKWLSEQKLIVEGKRKKKLTSEQLEKLKAIGFRYGISRNEETWYDHYDQLKQYYAEHGNIDIPPKYMVDGIDLNIWLKRQRALYRSGDLPQEYIDLLNELSVAWETSKESAWNRGFEHLEEFIHRNGVDALTATSVCDDGYKLGSWLSNCKTKYAKGKIEEQYLERFRTLGISLEPKESHWDEYYAEVVEYFTSNNVRKIPKDYRGKSGINLNGWLSDQKKYYKKGKLNEHQCKALETLGVIKT